MLQIYDLTDVELDNIKEIIQKGVEKSDLERYYLFSKDIQEKAKLFIYCHRFLCHVHNLLLDSKLKTVIKNEIDLTSRKYFITIDLLADYNKHNFGKHRLLNKLQSTIEGDKIVDDLIDGFAVLLERANLIDINKIQAFVLEGRSKDEFNKIFKPKDNSVLNKNVDENINNVEIPEGAILEEEQDFYDNEVVEDNNTNTDTNEKEN